MTRPIVWDLEVAKKVATDDDFFAALDRFYKDIGPAHRYVLDDSPQQTAHCTRRAGKSWAAAGKHIRLARRRPGGWSLYITPAKHISIRNLRAPLKSVCAAVGWDGTWKVEEGQQFVLFPNGHRLWVVGAADMTEAEKFRGEPYDGALIDECGTFKPDVLHYLRQAVLLPALSDRNGWLACQGTSTELPVGEFHDLTKADHVSHHSWSVLNNPHHPLGEPGALEAYRIQMGFKEDDPTWRREYLGEWVADYGALCYNYVDARNGFDELPKANDWRLVLSVDLGYEDDTAFTVSASRPGNSEVFFLESYGIPHMLLPQQAAERNRLRQKYQHVGRWMSEVIDTGGLGKAMTANLNTQYGCAFIPADKRGKAANIRAVRAGLASGMIKIKRGPDCAQLRGEMETVAWNDDHTDHHPSTPDHCSDSFLYGYREHPKFDQYEENEPEYGTSEYIDKMARKALEQSLQRSRARADGRKVIL